MEEYGPCPVFAIVTLAIALQLRKKHGKTSDDRTVKNLNSFSQISVCQSAYKNIKYKSRQTQ